ncbi:DUF3800 domain-containing protein [Halococcoides cellulosivorans]|nr:DUF3800 domain-containing protein [Halococcoides cellulosivorans]
MDLFGDESGTLRSVLNGRDEICVVAVVGGDRMDCIRCPKKAVRRVRDVTEARWSDLMDDQKRRVLDCMEAEDLQFGVCRITTDALHNLSHSYKLHQDRLSPAWDLVLKGDAYAELVAAIDSGAQRSRFRFDMVSDRSNAESIVEIVESGTEVDADWGNSRQIKGIQAADCLAGATADHVRHGEDWIDRISTDRIVDRTDAALERLEMALESTDSGP